MHIHMKKMIFSILVIIFMQGCINQKVTQHDIFNPIKEYELNSNFIFKKVLFQIATQQNLNTGI